MIYSHFAAFEASSNCLNQPQGHTTVYRYRLLQASGQSKGNCEKYLHAELWYLQGMSKLIPAALEVARAVPAPQRSETSLLQNRCMEESPTAQQSTQRSDFNATSNNRPNNQWSYIHILNGGISLCYCCTQEQM